MSRTVRLCLVVISVAAIVAAVLLRGYLIALGTGVAVGMVLFGTGAMETPRAGAPKDPRRKPRPEEKFGSRSGDVTARTGIALAAAGIASAALDPGRHFPDSFRIFYGFCLAAACLLALILASRRA